ncbi:Peptidoglycan/LPS O-acetylase OafA/YrhL, contains acyltransferase and SGNH-hydrolase domains [Chitinophaga sp. YR627]|uniref:acyltransferase family protein n=1 Tax=Chitinophaga sp. YR627 TaxID=1881041 RepID=UPI0008F0C9A9|nr:acyltransferase [Chitinophaga sp. YR627]SFP12158.1 Peptidoglycan/LPS O-acetylase OafA/YrhL, contains acyltransferase and SGNH-hydrolase domains [Chitinophaga sp. YR627]
MHVNRTQDPHVITKPHFEILDGLRGLAAIAVVIFHFMEIAVPDYHNSFISHSYLAVDFFFCLSGFVIAYAYDTKIAQIGVVEFMKLRLIRLHPLVVIGALIGLIVFIFDPFSNLYQTYASKTLLVFLSASLMIPYPLVKERYFNLFHLNPPTWSLFWEYIANIFYALVLVRIKNIKILWVLTILAAGALFYASKQANFLAVGWGGDNVSAGAARVAYSFLAGILAYRSGKIIRSEIGFMLIGALLLATFMIPFSEKYNWYLDPLVVIFFFPFLVLLGAGAQTNHFSHKICKFSGDISYPLYMIHYPFIWLFMSYVEKYKPSLPTMVWIMIAGTVLLTAMAYLVLQYIDTPIRKWLKNRRAVPAVAVVGKPAKVEHQHS